MSLLIENAKAVLTDNPGDCVDSILVDNGVIKAIGNAIDVPSDTQRIDARDCVVIPGLINTHHHMFQSLTRSRSHDQELFGWLSTFWRSWSSHDADWQYAATSVASAELLLSGCTTTVDHHYLPPGSNDADPLAAQIEAAGRLGIRLVQAMGSMNISDQNGGLAPAALCEGQEAFLARAERAINEHHDPSPGSRLQVALAPCHPLAATEALFRSVIDLARSRQVRLHTHIAEARNEERETLSARRMRPLELLESWGFVGRDVWLAHCVHLSDRDIQTLASTGTSVAVCPSSNLRLGSGIARVRDLLDAGVVVSLGVDGSASNDSGNALSEARQLMLSSRAHGLDRGITAYEALRIATSNGSLALGRADLGQLEVGQRADLAIFDMNTLGSVGTDSDPLAGLLLSPPPGARHVVIDGEVVVQDYQLVNGDISEIVDAANTIIAKKSMRHN